jgi:hypothetical protein
VVEDDTGVDNFLTKGSQAFRIHANSALFSRGIGPSETVKTFSGALFFS